MTVKELIEELQTRFSGDEEVRIAQPTHDHWRNVKAVEIESIEELEIKHSSYHDGDVIEECNSDREYRTAVILQ